MKKVIVYDLVFILTINRVGGQIPVVTSCTKYIRGY